MPCGTSVLAILIVVDTMDRKAIVVAVQRLRQSLHDDLFNVLDVPVGLVLMNRRSEL